MFRILLIPAHLTYRVSFATSDIRQDLQRCIHGALGSDAEGHTKGSREHQGVGTENEAVDHADLFTGVHAVLKAEGLQL